MVKWVHIITFIGIAFVISCEAKSPKRPTVDVSKEKNNDGNCHKHPTCGVNEVYDICPRLCPARRCDVDERIIRCGENPKPGDPKCKPGCRCADNYYRNNDGICVTRDECPKCFQKNEVYACQSSNPQTCETIDEEYEPIKMKKHCKRKCRCAEGFYRNKIGECISKENCLRCNGPHEYFSCGSACDNVCDTIHLQNQTHCPIINIKCNPRCYCEFGYARDHNNICVPIDECPKKCNRPNEVYECQSPCPETCEAIGNKCISKHISKRDCKRECRCKKGFYRNKLGDCISEKNCLKCNGPHEFFSCGGACDNVCATLNEQNQTSCPIVNIVCNQMCYCEKGYARDENNICVPIADCSPICGVNEVYDICPRICPLRKCGANGRIFCPRSPAPGDAACKPGCRCADNYYRNDIGVCVTKKECSKCHRKNEVYGCIRSNPQTCETIDEDYEPIENTKNCNQECQCKEGYYKNKIGECISKANCLKCNGPHEYFSCGSACDNVCATLHLQNQTNCPIINKACNKKCYCEEGYARDENDICIPVAECPAVCGVNEVYDICPSSCPPRRCDVDERLIKCRPYPQPGDPECKPGCRCADNFYKNELGFCVTRDECPPLLQCGENEYPSRCANGGCKKDSCAFPETVCVKLAEGACEEGCLCKENYLRADNGTCIPEDECPPVCGFNEVYDICPPACPPQRCDVNIAAVSCMPNPTPGDPHCNPGCRCADNHVRNHEGVCIPRDKCPPEPICGDNEELSDCVNGGCRRLKCSDEGITCYDLSENACVKGCVCIDSYLRADNGTCIPQDQCPQTVQCGINEEYSACANGGCRRPSCAVNGILCVDLREGGCKPGCICKESYTRADNRTCIPEDQCPPECGLNEVYDVCPAPCPPRSCDVDDRTIDCAPGPSPGDPDCNPGCRCADNYYRNDLGVCVTRDECPLLIQCGVNEVASRCANGGGCRKLSCAIPVTVCAKIPISSCEEGCVCKEDYLRADNGTCVPENECPPVCGINEVYDQCPPTCPPQRCDVDNRLIKCKRFPTLGDPECKPGCRCEDNFYKNELGVCVTREECPPLIKCGINEIASRCANGGCRKRSCARPQTICAKLPAGACKEGCVCKENYLRADNGTCISESECPHVCGINEVYDICPPTCPQQRCDVDISLILCKPNPQPGDPECNPGCRCADNYFKNSEGVCVLREECPPPIKCGLNEDYSTCANGGCRRYSCNMSAILCIDLKEGGCRPGCICKDTYTRDDNGLCIPEDECLPKPKRCGINEELSSCANAGCKRWKCSDRSHVCKDVVKGGCKKGCICKKSYTRSDDGTCIPEKQCPKICGPNEEYGCDKICTKTCNIVDGKCVPPNNSKICKLQCHCKNGYRRNNEGECVSECVGVTEKKQNGLTAFEQGNIDFTGQFLDSAYKNNPGESVICSPFSVLFLLAQLALYATGLAKTQLLNLLNLKNDCEIRTSVPMYLKLISETNNASFDLAQKIYGSDKYPFSKNFLKDSKEVFNAEAQNVNFAKPEKAASIINKWVAEKTHDLINDLISPDALSANTRLVLVNAIYFKGDWKHQFKERNTKLLPFYTGNKNNDEVQVKMMNQVAFFKYAEIDGVQVLQMPYTVPEISFVACLPRSKTGIKKLIQKIKKTSFIKRTLSELKSTRVDVSIPNIDISTSSDLKQVLKDAGVNAIFDPATAGLSGILENPEDIFVTSGIQKAILKLNETGTVAAAASAVVVGVRSLPISQPEPVIFNANRPFIYYIVVENSLVFAGIYAGPQ